MLILGNYYINIIKINNVYLLIYVYNLLLVINNY